MSSQNQLNICFVTLRQYWIEAYLCSPLCSIPFSTAANVTICSTCVMVSVQVAWNVTYCVLAGSECVNDTP